jgi:hypothetical protein
MHRVNLKILLAVWKRRGTFPVVVAPRYKAGPPTYFLLLRGCGEKYGAKNGQGHLKLPSRMLRDAYTAGSEKGLCKSATYRMQAILPPIAVENFFHYGNLPEFIA